MSRDGGRDRRRYSAVKRVKDLPVTLVHNLKPNLSSLLGSPRVAEVPAAHVSTASYSIAICTSVPVHKYLGALRDDICGHDVSRRNRFACNPKTVKVGLRSFQIHRDIPLACSVTSCQPLSHPLIHITHRAIEPGPFVSIPTTSPLNLLQSYDLLTANETNIQVVDNTSAPKIAFTVHLIGKEDWLERKRRCA